MARRSGSPTIRASVGLLAGALSLARQRRSGPLCTSPPPSSRIAGASPPARPGGTRYHPFLRSASPVSGPSQLVYRPPSQIATSHPHLLRRASACLRPPASLVARSAPCQAARAVPAAAGRWPCPAFCSPPGRRREMALRGRRLPWACQQLIWGGLSLNNNNGAPPSNVALHLPFISSLKCERRRGDRL